MSAEESRLQALSHYQIIDTKPEEAFDNLAKLARYICDAESAQINFIDDKRQWSKSNLGWGQGQMPKEHSFCVHTIQDSKAPLIIYDARMDDRFSQNPLIRGEPPLRFYAGMPINSVNNYPIGSVCVFGSQPGELDERQLESLKIIAKEIETHLKLRLDHDELSRQLEQENRLNNKIINNLPINFFMFNSSGNIVRWNQNIKETTGYRSSEISDMNPWDYFAKKERQQVKSVIRRVLEGNDVTLESHIEKKNGEAVPILQSLSRIKMNGQYYLIGTGQDITEQKRNRQKLKSLIGIFGKFVPNKFIKLLNKQALTQVELGDQIKENITILFADIRGFTSISETLTTEDNFNLLNAFLKRIGPCIRRENGIIDKYIGDGIMALFPDSPTDAVRASIAMQEEIREYNDKRKSRDLVPLNFNIGLHFGDVQLGIIGDETRYQATVISDDVNQTFRIEELANHFDAPLVISKQVYHRITDKDQWEFRHFGKMTVKGKNKPISVIEVIDANNSEIASLKKKSKKLFNAGIEDLQEGFYADSIQKLSEVLKIYPNDTASQYFINRALSKISEPAN